MVKRTPAKFILLRLLLPLICLLTIGAENNTPLTLQTVLHTTNPIKSPYLKPQVVKLALKAYDCAHKAKLTTSDLITVVDYSLPSTVKRLWVIDVRHNRILFNTLVAHGQGSGTNYPHRFSDRPQTHASSLGLFLTMDSYYGHLGLALRLKGLEPGFNGNARSRAIVFHGGWYVTEAFAKAHGFIGRSWGCFAIDPKINERIINLIKGGTLVFSYYPDDKWLTYSHFLHCPLV